MQSCHVSPSGVALLTRLECRRLRIYDDANGKPWDGKSTPIGRLTIGIGHVLSAGDVISGRYADGITDEQCDDMLRRDLVPREQTVSARVKPELGQHSFDACVLLIYNIGTGAFSSSALLRAINAGELSRETLTPLWMAWCHADGKENAGLKLRRAKELALFFEPDPDVSPNVDQVMANVYEAAAKILADDPLLTQDARQTIPD